MSSDSILVTQAPGSTASSQTSPHTAHGRLVGPTVSELFSCLSWLYQAVPCCLLVSRAKSSRDLTKTDGEETGQKDRRSQANGERHLWGEKSLWLLQPSPRSGPSKFCDPPADGEVQTGHSLPPPGPAPPAVARRLTG